MFIRYVFAALFAALAAYSGVAQAATDTSTFKVNLALTPKCYINISAAPASTATTDVNLTYTSMQVTDSDGSTSFAVTCTNTLGYSLAITADTDSVAGINYFLKLVAGSTPSYVSAVGGGALASLAGDGTAQTYSVGVRAPASQSGTCAVLAGCSGFKTHTVTISY